MHNGIKYNIHIQGVSEPITTNVHHTPTPIFLSKKKTYFFYKTNIVFIYYIPISSETCTNI